MNRTLEAPSFGRVPIRQQSDLRLHEPFLDQVNLHARRLGWATLGALARPPEEKEWIQVQFYHWVLDDQRAVFRKQLASLSRYGDFISLDDAVQLLRSGRPIGGRYFCITFDDGFKNCLTNAASVLSELGIPAAFFIPTRFIGLRLEEDWEQIAPFFQRSWSEFAGAFEFLDWEDCRLLTEAGFTLGSHTHTHRRLTSLTPVEAEAELRLSKGEIETRLGLICRHFCCPWGKTDRDFDPAVHPAMARAIGYESFLTTEEGLNLNGDSPFYLRRSGCEPDHSPAMLKYALFTAPGSPRKEKLEEPAPDPARSAIRVVEPDLIRVRKFPYPYQAAFSLASDIDSASIARFEAIHTLVCSQQILRPDSVHWHTLGLDPTFPRFDQNLLGISGLGLDFADSFFLVGDPTTFGMYRHASGDGRFVEDQEEGISGKAFIQERLKRGEIDSFHAFLHYRRDQIEPLLREFYGWCEQEAVQKPRVWINHSLAVTPTGLCPAELQPNRFFRLARLSGRAVVGPMLGRKRLALRSAFARYQGDHPSSPYYINDLLADNGLRYVWLNMDDLACNRVALPERILNGRDTFLEPITMEDGVRYYRFSRCYGKPAGRPGGESYLRESPDGFDGSCLITEGNLAKLCQSEGTCILYTHWAHFRSFPISHETMGHFAMLQRWRDEGKVWVTGTARLLEWTRKRTFLDLSATRQAKGWTIELLGVDDPVFGREPVTPSDLDGLCLELPEPCEELRLAVAGVPLDASQIHRAGNLCWLSTAGGAEADRH